MRIILSVQTEQLKSKHKLNNKDKNKIQERRFNINIQWHFKSWKAPLSLHLAKITIFSDRTKTLTDSFFLKEVAQANWYLWHLNAKLNLTNATWKLYIFTSSTESLLLKQFLVLLAFKIIFQLISISYFKCITVCLFVTISGIERKKQMQQQQF